MLVRFFEVDRHVTMLVRYSTHLYEGEVLLRHRADVAHQLRVHITRRQQVDNGLIIGLDWIDTARKLSS